MRSSSFNLRKRHRGRFGKGLSRRQGIISVGVIIELLEYLKGYYAEVLKLYFIAIKNINKINNCKSKETYFASTSLQK